MFETGLGKTEQEPVPNRGWFDSIISKISKYKSNLFGAGDCEMRLRRARDYVVKPTVKFVLARSSDGHYRPASITGRCTKKQVYSVQFYHNKKNAFLPGNHIILKHGNLLNATVTFLQHGKEIVGKVYGNNSPTNKGLPTLFYVKRNEKWHKVPMKMIHLTKKQLQKAQNCKTQIRGDEAAQKELDEQMCIEKCTENLDDFDMDYEMR